MSRAHIVHVALIALGGFTCSKFSNAVDAPRLNVDAFGDPLPAGSTARIGSSRLRHTGGTRDVAFSADGRLIISLGGDGLLVAWDSATGKRRWSSNQSVGARSVAVAKTVNALVTYELKRGLVAYTFDEAQLREELVIAAERGPQNPILAISTDGRYCAASGLSDETVVWRRLANGQWERALTSPIVGAKGTRLCFSPDGQFLSCSPVMHGGIMVLDVATAKSVLDLTSVKIGELIDFDFLPNSADMLIVTKGAEQTHVELVANLGGNVSRKRLFSSKRVLWARAHKDGKSFWSLEDETTVVLRGIEDSEPQSRIVIQEKLFERLSPVALSSDIRQIAFATHPVQLFDLTSGRRLLGHDTAGLNRSSGMPVFNTDERRVMFADSAWELATGRPVLQSSGETFLTMEGSTVTTLRAQGDKITIGPLNGHSGSPPRSPSETLIGVGPGLATPQLLPILTSHYSADAVLKLEAVNPINGSVQPTWRFAEFRDVLVPDPRVVVADPHLESLAGLDRKGRIHLVTSRNGAAAQRQAIEWLTLDEFRTSECVLTFSSDGKLLAGLDYRNCALAIWDTSTLRRVASIRVQDVGEIARTAPSGRNSVGELRGFDAWCCFSADNKDLVVLWFKRGGGAPFPDAPLIVAVYDVSRGETTHRERVITSSQELITYFASFDALALWFPANVRFFAPADVRRRAVEPLSDLRNVAAVSTDGAMCATVLDDGRIGVLETVTGQEIARFNSGTSRITTLAFSPSSRFLIGRAFDDNYLVWDLATATAGQQESPPSLDDLWANLASRNAPLAYHAASLLAERGAEAIPFLSGKLKESVNNGPDIKSLVSDLEHDHITRSERAWRQLNELYGEHHAWIASEARNCQSESVRRSVGRLITTGTPTVNDTNVLRRIRAVSVIARISSMESRALLAHVARGDLRDPAVARARLIRAQQGLGAPSR